MRLKVHVPQNWQRRRSQPLDSYFNEDEFDLPRGPALANSELEDDYGECVTGRGRGAESRGAPGYSRSTSSDELNVLHGREDERFPSRRARNRYDAVGRGPAPGIGLASRSSSNTRGFDSSELRHQVPNNGSELLALLRSLSIQQNKLSEEVENLKTRNVELKDHNAELEAELALLAQDVVHDSAVADPEAERGNPPSRGTAHKRKKAATRNAKRVMRVVDSPEPEVQVREKIAVDLALAVTTELKEYEIEIKCAKRALQDEVTRGFHGVIGVPGKAWPDLSVERSNDTTGEVYMNPLFEATVQHPQNHQLFCEVVKQVECQLIKNSDSLLPSLKHETLNFTWERDLLYEMTKTSFRQRDHVNQQVNRRRERRVTKTKQLEKAVVPYAAKRRVPAQVIKDVFVHEQYMSDEASGPEDNSETNKAVWETRMALKRGYEHANNKNILEVLACEWRSDEVDVRCVARDAKHCLSALLEDWGKYPDPEGFGASLGTGEDAAGNADEAHDVEGAMAEED
ncbi:hypothetical protein B0H13DRAFT_2393489 [Mycena leptocephala]|nr:hypothetical protein B0H13DRAFT_2393489 [Mycena leptocephala]